MSKEISKPKRSNAAVAMIRSSVANPEMQKWRLTVSKPRVRKLIREFPFPPGHVELMLMQAAVETGWMAEVAMNYLMPRLKSDERAFLDPEVRQVIALYQSLRKSEKEHLSTLLMTPSAKQGAMIDANRNDAFALLAEARREILGRQAIER